MARDKKSRDPVNCIMSLGDHLEELRARVILALAGLFVAMIVCIIFGKIIIRFIEMPYVWAMGEQARLQIIAPADGFISYFQITMVAGAIVSSPWIFYQLWKFVAAGLYERERRYIYYAVPFSTGLFITGALFFVLVIAPVTLRVLVMFNKQVLGTVGIVVDSNFTFKNYVSFIAGMMLAFGIAFQTPVVIFVLTKIGIVSIETICKSRKYVMLSVFVVSAAVTPGSDMFSLFALAIPMYLLFELGIMVSRLSHRKKQLNNVSS